MIDMRAALAILAVATALTATGAEAKTSAGSDKMKACAAQWQGMKAAKTATGSYRDFSKTCMAGSTAGAAPAASPTAAPPPAPTATPAKAKRSKAAAAVTPMASPSPAPSAPQTATTAAPAPAVGAYKGKSITSDAAGATGQCKDGTYTHATHHSGACSHHGGVAKWM